MDYAKCKELKDAGFPQKGEGDYLFYKTASMGPSLTSIAKDVYRPSLEELIEACGGDLRYLQRTENSTEWVAGTYDSYESGEGLPDSNVWAGGTPKEAVANLWLALNKNHDPNRVRQDS